LIHSHSIKMFLLRRIEELLGISFLGSAIFILLSLYSYDPLDPSWNTIVDGPIQNYGGALGAFLADVLKQGFGLASYIIPVIFLTWGLHFLKTKNLRFLGLRIVGLFFSLLLTSSLLYQTFSAKLVSTNIGGAFGFLGSYHLQQQIAKWNFSWNITITIITFLATLCFIVSSGLRLEHLHTILRWAYLVPTILLSLLRKSYLLVSQRWFLFSKEDTTLRSGLFSQEDPKFEPLSTEKSFSEEVDISLSSSLKVTDSQPKVFKNVQEKIPSSTPKKEPPLNLTQKDSYHLPSLDLLTAEPIASKNSKIPENVLRQNAQQLMAILGDFGVKGEITHIRPGPVVTLYELIPAPGIKASRVIGLADDIARSMSALSARIAVIPGHNAIGIELPNKDRQTVFLRELFKSQDYESPGMKLAIALGKDISGTPIIADLARMPHLLVAGTTGSGKSVGINAMILSLLYRLSPERCRFIMIDPKMLELSVYDGIPHLLTPVVTEPKKAVFALKWVVKEMEERYRAMSKLGVRNIEGYNARLSQAQAQGEILSRQVQTGFDPETGRPIYETQPLDTSPLPYIVVFVDEMADLMLVAGKDIELAVQRLAQMARAAGIHIIMATQRPSVDVITGTIKANFPTRISFQVTSRFDSRTILGEQGAEQLLGRGDMLFMEPGGKIQRVHGPFVGDSEVEQVVRFLKAQGTPQYIETITEEHNDAPLGSFGSEDDGGDQLYHQAIELVRRERKASTSFIQRHLQIGYNRAARIMEQMENEGIVSAANHVGKREVLLPSAS
jgi:S-DNA-T family DNA segregation ATPase FtsK/SpoIIIE